MSTHEKLHEAPKRCPKCKQKGTIKATPAAFWCSNVDGCTWTAAKASTMAPRSLGQPGTVAERRDY